MHGEMVGMFEVRTQRGNTNYRLFCLLERDADDLGGSSIVCIDGLAKPKRSKAHEREYRRVRAFAGEFRRRRSVMS